MHTTEARSADCSGGGSEISVIVIRLDVLRKCCAYECVYTNPGLTGLRGGGGGGLKIEVRRKIEQEREREVKREMGAGGGGGGAGRQRITERGGT